MNILQVLPELRVGGVETGTVDLARHLVKAGHKAVVVSGGGELVAELESCGAVHYKLPVHKKSLFSMIGAVSRLAEVIKKEGIDIVHARSRVPAWIAYFACRRTGVVFITTCHGYYSKHFFSQVMGWGKRVIALSNIIARHMLDDFGVPHERISFVPRGVDLSRFSYMNPDEKRKKGFNVGIIARMTPLKGHLHFMKAMAKAARAIPDLKIWVVGSAPPSKEAYKEQVEVLTKRLGLWNCTEFLGTQRDIAAILSHLDLLVMATTTHEAFGRVVIEAQASGVPVVATAVGGVVDIIEDGKNGLLVPPADADRMADAAVRVFKDPAFARQLAESAYLKVKEKYNVELMVRNTLSVYEDALNNFRILIIKFSSLGDIILSTAALRAVKERFGKDHKITFLVGEEYKDALIRSPYIDELLVADLKGRDKGPKGLWKLGRDLRRRNFDMVIDLQNNRASHILSFLAFAPLRYGYNRKFGFLLNRRIKNDKAPIDPVTHQFRVLDMMGIKLVDPHLELWPSEADERYADELLSGEWLSSSQKLVGINLSASPRWQTKGWPVRYIAKLCEALGERDIRLVLTGTGNDAARASELALLLKKERVINACGKTNVNQLACLIKRCSVYISADSSPLHIAAAMKVPFVALFGPTDPRRHLGSAQGSVLLKKDLPCSPCYKPKCKSKKCMTLITVEEVLEAVEKLMKKSL